MILAGGLGTRLRAAVNDRPKVLALVAGRPFLTYLLDRLAHLGVEETILLVGYAADQIRGTIGSDHAGMRITYSEETAPLGTAGAVRLALPLLRHERFLLFNGDSFCDVDLPRFTGVHGLSEGIGLVLTRVDDASRYGQVQFEPDGRISRFEEKGGQQSAGWISAGIYLLTRQRLASIPPDQPVSLERDLLPGWVKEGHLWGFPGGRFIDIGTPESYAEAERFFHSAAPGVDRSEIDGLPS